MTALPGSIGSQLVQAPIPQVGLAANQQQARCLAGTTPCIVNMQQELALADCSDEQHKRLSLMHCSCCLQRTAPQLRANSMCCRASVWCCSCQSSYQAPQGGYRPLQQPASCTASPQTHWACPATPTAAAAAARGRAAAGWVPARPQQKVCWSPAAPGGRHATVWRRCLVSRQGLRGQQGAGSEIVHGGGQGAAGGVGPGGGGGVQRQAPASKPSSSPSKPIRCTWAPAASAASRAPGQHVSAVAWS